MLFNVPHPMLLNMYIGQDTDVMFNDSFMWFIICFWQTEESFFGAEKNLPLGKSSEMNFLSIKR